jgi:hypothetical protein
MARLLKFGRPPSALGGVFDIHGRIIKENKSSFNINNKKKYPVASSGLGLFSVKISH